MKQRRIKLDHFLKTLAMLQKKAVDAWRPDDEYRLGYEQALRDIQEVVVVEVNR